MWNVLDRCVEFERRSSSARSRFGIPEADLGVDITICNLGLR
jgi:hypothetical protein